MGTVWLAEHVMLGRQVAIKVLHREASARAELVERFFNEAKAATAISDPGIIQIFDFGLNTDGHAYIVMELLEGESLDQRLRRMSKLPLASSLRILRQVASSLGAAHRRGIIHRDMKPDNVFLVRDPEVAGGERTKILDFGIAKLSSEHQRVKTQTSAVMGTPVFMSPEQCRGAGQVDRRSDVYSLGCVLYTLLTGHPPFDGEGPGDIIAMHLREPAPAPSREVPGLPPEIDELVLRCMAKDRDHRYDSGTELAAAIEALIEKLAPLFASTGAPAAARTVSSGEIGGGGARPRTGQPQPPQRPSMSPPRMETGPAAPTLTPVPPPGAQQPWGQSSSSGSNARPRQATRAASEESTAAFPKISPPSPMPPPSAQPQFPSPMPSSAQPQPQFPSPMPPSMAPPSIPPVSLETFATSGARPATSNSSTTLSAYAGSRGSSKRSPRRLWMAVGVAAVGVVLGVALVTQLAGGAEPSSTTGNDAALALGPDLAGSGAAPTDPTPAPEQGPGDSASPGSAVSPEPSPSTGDGAAAGGAEPAPAPTVDPASARAAAAGARTEDNLRAVVAAFARWAPNNEDQPCPSLSTLALPGAESRDGWGNDVRITCEEQPAALQMGVVSAGADGRFSTDDDVFSWSISGASDQVRGHRWVAKALEKVPAQPPERPAEKPPGKRERPTPVIGSQTPRPVVPDKQSTRQPKPKVGKKLAIDPVTGLPLTRNPIQKPK